MRVHGKALQKKIQAEVELSGSIRHFLIDYNTVAKKVVFQNYSEGTGDMEEGSFCRKKRKNLYFSNGIYFSLFNVFEAHRRFFRVKGNSMGLICIN